MLNKALSNWRNRLPMIIGGAIAVGLLSVGAVRLISSQEQSNRDSSESTVSLPQRVEVAALGRLEPQGEVVRVGGPGGDRISRLMVAEGDTVQAGQVLAYLESYEERLAERDYAATQLAEAERRLQAETTYGQAKIQEAQTRLQQVDRPRSFEMEAQQATVRQFEAELDLANEDLQRSQSLYGEGAIARQELDRQITEVRQKQEQLNNAQATLVRLETTRDTDMQNAQAQVQMAQADLPLAQVQAAVESARQNLNLAQARLERTVIRAPNAGRVLRILAQAGEAIGNDGILDLGDTSQMFVVAEVYETDVGLVKVGQPAVITSRNGAFETPLSGQVSEIGWQIFKNDVLDDDPAANADARVVEVKIRLDQSDSVEALTNLQVDVRIDVEG